MLPDRLVRGRRARERDRRGDAAGAPAARTFLLLRFTLIIATGYLLLGQSEAMTLRGTLLALLAGALASNLLLAVWRPHLLASPLWTAAVLVVDTLWVTAALLVSGREEAVTAARTEQLLRRTNRQLQELSELKSRFVSLVSHELRTPLTATGNALGLVGRTGPLTPEQNRFLEMAGRNLDRLGRILDDLLSLSKMEAKGLDITFAGVDPAELLTDAAAAF